MRMKTLLVLMTLSLSLETIASTPDYLKISKDINNAKFSDCLISAKYIESTGTEIQIRKAQDLSGHLLLSDETFQNVTVRQLHHKSLHFSDTFFVQAWGPLQYQGDRNLTGQIHYSRGKLKRIFIKLTNLDFPWNTVKQIDCKTN